jgi:hypothetical protein
VPVLLLTREERPLDDLRRTLAAYPSVFGQPRQEDLVALLQGQMTDGGIQKLIEELRIYLSPPPVSTLDQAGRGQASKRDSR